MRARAAAWTLAGLGISLGVTYHVLDLLNDRRVPLPVVGTLVATLFLIVGALIASNRPRNPIGWIFLVALVLISLGGTGNVAEQYAYYALVTRPGSLPGADWIVWAGGVALNTGFVTLICFSLLLFPNGRPPSARWRPLTFAAAAAVVLAAVSNALSDWGEIAPGVSVANPLHPARDVSAVAGLIVMFSAAVALACVASVFVRFFAAPAAERQQLKWFAFGAACIPATLLIAWLLSMVAPSVFDAVSAELWPLSVAGIPITTGIAILRFRLYDIDVVIERTLVYAALSAVLVAMYWLFVLLLQSALRPLTGGSELAVAASTLATLALAQPLRAAIQRRVDRRFYRRRYDAERTLDFFSDRLRDQVDIDMLERELLAVVGDAIQPAHASVWLRSRS
jgi:hypothetical protein